MKESAQKIAPNTAAGFQAKWPEDRTISIPVVGSCVIASHAATGDALASRTKNVVQSTNAPMYTDPQKESVRIDLRASCCSSSNAFTVSWRWVSFFWAASSASWNTFNFSSTVLDSLLLFLENSLAVLDAFSFSALLGEEKEPVIMPRRDDFLLKGDKLPSVFALVPMV